MSAHTAILSLGVKKEWKKEKIPCSSVESRSPPTKLDVNDVLEIRTFIILLYTFSSMITLLDCCYVVDYIDLLFLQITTLFSSFNREYDHLFKNTP